MISISVILQYFIHIYETTIQNFINLINDKLIKTISNNK